jgi:hypothetical protein
VASGRSRSCLERLGNRDCSVFELVTEILPGVLWSKFDCLEPRKIAIQIFSTEAEYKVVFNATAKLI